MSLTADIISYLTNQGHIDETNWRSSVGIQQMPPRVSAALQVVAVENISTIRDVEAHDDNNRFEGFRLMVRGKQHDNETVAAKFRAVFDSLQDQVTALNADSDTTETFELIHSDNGGPIVSYGKGDRVHMTATFKVLLAK